VSSEHNVKAVVKKEAPRGEVEAIELTVLSSELRSFSDEDRSNVSEYTSPLGEKRRIRVVEGDDESTFTVHRNSKTKESPVFIPGLSFRFYVVGYGFWAVSKDMRAQFTKSLHSLYKSSTDWDDLKVSPNKSREPLNVLGKNWILAGIP
jgi:hypothetical protein